MNTYLLLGAGFSHNWGGLLAEDVFNHLLGCPEIADDPELKKIMWDNSTSGFESALEQVQKDYKENPTSDIYRGRLNDMQSAVARVFREMNEAFYNKLDFEFHNNRAGTIRHFLTQFDAIFTLNQDLLLEHHYVDNFDVALETPRRWDSIQIPGMLRIPVDDPMFHKSWARAQWRSLSDAEYKIQSRCQPYIKLHGSSNWISVDGNPLLIIGGNKDKEIQLHPILRRYATEFITRLCKPHSRLMVIGYGFKDHHINKAIAQAVYQHDLKIFIVSPQGRDLSKVLKSNTHAGADMAVYGYDLEDVFRKSLIGASRQLLREIFGNNSTVEHSNMLKLFTHQQ